MVILLTFDTICANIGWVLWSSKYNRSFELGANFVLKINQTGRDLIDKKYQIRTCRREKHPPVLFGTLDLVDQKMSKNVPT